MPRNLLPRTGRRLTPGSKAKNPYRKLAPPPAHEPMKVRKNLFSYGPAILGISRGPIQEKEGPGDPPAGFVGGTTSKTEWWVWWALDKICTPIGIEFSYQSSYAGGRHTPGGAVVDFVVYMPLQEILIRVQTYRFHFTLGSDKQGYDVEQKVELSQEEGSLVIDIYEQDFIDDPTGKKVLKVVSDAINGIERSNPLATGNVYDLGM